MTDLGRAPPSDLDLSRRPVSEDRLDRLRVHVRTLLGQVRALKDAERRVADLNIGIYKMRHEVLPDLFDEAGVTGVDLPAEGNQLAMEVRLEPHYKANISAEWAPERRAAAFKWLDDNGHGDLIKTTITVFLGRDEREKAKEVRAALGELGLSFDEGLAVPWNTLTAWLKEQHQKNETLPPLDLIGAEIGRVAKTKEIK